MPGGYGHVTLPSQPSRGLNASQVEGHEHIVDVLAADQELLALHALDDEAHRLVEASRRLVRAEDAEAQAAGAAGTCFLRGGGQEGARNAAPPERGADCEPGDRAHVV